MGPSSGEFGARGVANHSSALEFGARDPSPGLAKWKRQRPRLSHEAVTVTAARCKQSFDLLEPKAGVAHPLVDLDPRHALVA
jgi:hypothetical protein